MHLCVSGNKQQSSGILPTAFGLFNACIRREQHSLTKTSFVRGWGCTGSLAAPAPQSILRKLSSWRKLRRLRNRVFLKPLVPRKPLPASACHSSRPVVAATDWGPSKKLTMPQRLLAAAFVFSRPSRRLERETHTGHRSSTCMQTTCVGLPQSAVPQADSRGSRAHATLWDSRSHWALVLLGCWRLQAQHNLAGSSFLALCGFLALHLLTDTNKVFSAKQKKAHMCGGERRHPAA